MVKTILVPSGGSIIQGDVPVGGLQSIGSVGDTAGPGQSPAAYSDAESEALGIPHEATATQARGSWVVAQENMSLDHPALSNTSRLASMAKK